MGHNLKTTKTKTGKGPIRSTNFESIQTAGADFRDQDSWRVWCFLRRVSPCESEALPLGVGQAFLMEISTRKQMPTLGIPDIWVTESERTNTNHRGGAPFCECLAVFQLGFQRLKSRSGKILHKPGMLWGRAISLSTARHTLKCTILWRKRSRLE